MALQCGIVGLPNVGKSTIFKALTESKADIANYPFCTIDPNKSSVIVPDDRLDALADVFKPGAVIPTTVEIVDIAGLVKGASTGEGLGNQFLSHIREVDAICHVVRCFEDPNITHVHGTIDPLQDLAVIETELTLKDLDTVTHRYEKSVKQAKHQKQGEAEVALLAKLLPHLEEGEPLRSLILENHEKEMLDGMQLLTSKPVLYVANVAEDALPEGGELALKLAEFAKAQGCGVVILSGKIEAELADLSREDRNEFMEQLGLTKSGKVSLIQAVYKLLHMETFFTAGEKEVRAWTVTEGTLAPQAGGTIHSDFERGFIAAETIHWHQLVQCGGYPDARHQGKLRTEGKSYMIQDGDVCVFRFNV